MEPIRFALLTMLFLGVAIFYFAQMSDSADLERKHGISSTGELDLRIEKEFTELLHNNEITAAVEKIGTFIEENGGDELESYEIDIQSGHIALNEKKGGLRLIIGPFLKAYTQELISDKVYKLTEVYEMFKSNPGQFRGKDILIEGFAEPGVMCVGCCGYTLLYDCDDLDFFKTFWSGELPITPDRRLTEEQKMQKNRDINLPRLDADIIDKSRYINELGMDHFWGECHIFQGHFYDLGTQVCQDGWKRFVVTEIK
ncbi:hypothetical protein ACFL38_00110 [Candidatus Omnitrophota bacterium]